MLTHHALDGVSQGARRISVTAATGRQENKPRMATTIGEALCGYWTEVLDVVGHDRPLLASRHIEYSAVGSLRQVRTLAHCLDVEPALTQDTCDLVRELLIEQRLHVASARRPASQAA